MKTKALVLAILMAGCASGGFDKARQTMTGAVTALVAVTDALPKIDLQRQQDIVKSGKEAGKTREQVIAELEAWRAARTELYNLALKVWDGVKAAARALSIAENGVNADYGKLVKDILAALVELQSALAKYGIKIPGVS